MDELRIVGISTSPRRGNTELLVSEALDEAAKLPGVKTELVSLAGKNIRGCINCRRCIKEGKCFIQDDWAEAVRALVDPVPDGVIIGSPVYFYHMCSQGRAFLERCTSLVKSRYFDYAVAPAPDWSRTAAGAVAVGHDRNGGQEHAITDIVHWFLANEFVVVGGGYQGYAGAAAWLGGETGLKSVAGDKHGVEIARFVGRRVAETARLLKRGMGTGGSLA